MLHPLLKPGTIYLAALQERTITQLDEQLDEKQDDVDGSEGCGDYHAQQVHQGLCTHAECIIPAFVKKC